MTNPDDEYFARLDQEKKDKLRHKVEEQLRSEEAEKRKAAYYNKCGKCGTDMETRVHRGLQIEVCPACGAVLLDAGELEALSGEDKSGFFQDLASFFGNRKA